MKNYLQFFTLLTIVLLAAFSRVIPHMPNFSPLGAIALFGAAHFAQKWQAFLIPLAATWLSDLYLNNVVYAAYYPEFTWFYDGFYWQYGSYVLIALWGMWIFKKISVLRSLGGALGASLLFFAVSNFGVWAIGTMYPPTLEGLMACYVAAIPFFQGTLYGDLFFTAVLFGGYYLLQRKFDWLKLPNVSYQ